MLMKSLSRPEFLPQGGGIPKLNGRVLIVDDSADNRKIFGYFVKPTGLEFDMAENGRQAIRQAFESDYREILLDMQMPEVDGYTATAELSRLGYDRPIIALTAHALSEDRQRCPNVGTSRDSGQLSRIRNSG